MLDWIVENREEIMGYSHGKLVNGMYLTIPVKLLCEHLGITVEELIYGKA